MLKAKLCSQPEDAFLLSKGNIATDILQSVFFMEVLTKGKMIFIFYMFQSLRKMRKYEMLTRAEELVLLAVWRLGKDAYSVHVRNQLMTITRMFWSFGGVYMPLDRLEKRGLLTSHLADPTRERGGRSKRIYSLTSKGLEALEEIKRIQKEAWEGLGSPEKQ